MLERLRIRRFRGFKDLQIDGLSRINLVAGANNAGKTTLLEAVFLLGAGGNPRVLGYRVLGADFASVTGRKGADVRGSYG